MAEMGMDTARARELARQVGAQLSVVDQIVAQLSTTRTAASAPAAHGIVRGDIVIAPWSVSSVAGAAADLVAARNAISELLGTLGAEIKAQDAASGNSEPLSKFLLAAHTPGKNTGGSTSDGRYSIGSPQQPSYDWDEGFIYNSQSPNAGDFLSAARWKAQAAGARAVRWDLKDGLDAYDHYWSNTGDPWVFDYQSAYDSDEHVRANVDNEMLSAQRAAEELAVIGGPSFSFTGKPAGSVNYPITENWQKAIGAYQQWSSGEVTVDGDQMTMTVTVTADDHYNFNPGQQDIASKSPDDENGRFTELGWAKPFDSSGSITRTITWTVGDPGSATIVEKADDR
jgi:hypothetical protein